MVSRQQTQPASLGTRKKGCPKKGCHKKGSRPKESSVRLNQHINMIIVLSRSATISKTSELRCLKVVAFHSRLSVPSSEDLLRRYLPSASDRQVCTRTDSNDIRSVSTTNISSLPRPCGTSPLSFSSCLPACQTTLQTNSPNEQALTHDSR